MISKNAANRIIHLLIFLCAMNFFNQSSWLLVVVFVLIIIIDKGKVYVCAKDSTFWILIFFAITFFLFAAQNGIASGFPAIGCPMAYYIGTRMQRDQENERVEKQLNSMVIRLTAGMTLHAIINFVYELIRFGGINSGGVHYDFFSLGEKTSATGAATYLTLLAGAMFYSIMEADSARKWLIGFAAIIIAFVYDTTLGGRTFFGLAALAFALSMITYVVCQKDVKEKAKAFKKVIFTLLAIIVVALLLFLRYKDEIIKLFESTYLYHRIEYARTRHSQSLLDFFTSSDRGIIRRQYIKLMPQYLWGGRKILDRVGFYAHELWLDIFDIAGIVPYVLSLVITVQITYNSIRYMTGAERPIKNKVLIAGITASVTAQLFLEPVLTGCRALLFSYLIICGMIKSQLSQNRRIV